MHTRTASLAAAAAFLAFAPAAFAADMPVAPPPIQATVPEQLSYDWSGFYVGVNGGFAWGEITDDLDDSADMEGGLAGGTVGYNMQWGNWVAGLEADGAWSGIDNEDDNALYDASLDWLVTARGRVGYAFDRFLVYATGGLAAGEISYDDGTIDDSDTGIGFTVGGGIEAGITENISLKGEYLYVNLDDTDVGEATVDFDAHVVRGGLNFRF